MCKMSQALTEGVVPTRHLRPLTAFLAHPAMGFFGQTPLVGLPEITETVTVLISVWNFTSPAGSQPSLMVFC